MENINNGFQSFGKIPRLSREAVLSEKIDGTNASIFIWDDTKLVPAGVADIPVLFKAGNLLIAAGSRNRWITPEHDNYGFSAWVQDNAEELLKLGPGMHRAEWWGLGIQRGYGLKERRFSLFNTERWAQAGQPLTEGQEVPPACCHVVPVLHRGIFSTDVCDQAIEWLRERGSKAAPGYPNPEGIVVYHTASTNFYKKTIMGDESPKGQKR